jgi:6-pyruvoyl-tetrahydropterin synthase
LKTRFGIDVFSESPLVFASTNAALSDISTAAYLWKVEFYGYKNYYIGHEDCPITDGGFSLTTFGSGNADITLARCTLPLRSQDRINIYYKNTKMWSGFLSKEPDRRSGKLDLSPQIEKFNNAIYNGALNGTWSTAISAVLADSNDVTGISYNSYKIGLTSTNTVSITYDYTNVKSLFDDMINTFDGKYYGVDAVNEMYLTSYSTTITKIIYTEDNPGLTDVKVTIDDTKIKATRAQVFQRSTATNSNVRRGQVGYASPYPPFLEVEQRTGIKEVKVTVPQSLVSAPSSQSEALNYAYQQIKAGAVVNTNVSIKNLDYDKYPVTIGEYIRVYQPKALTWATILDCESITGWNNATLSTSISKRGTGSIQISTAITSYEWGRYNSWSGVKKIGFFLYSNNYGNLLSFQLQNALPTGSTYSFGAYSMSTGISSSSYNVAYFQPNTWQWIEFPTTWQDFSVVSFQALTTDAIYIDDISIYGYNKNYYDVNVKEIKFNFNNNLVDVTAGYFDQGLNDEFFALEKKVKALEETLQT